MIKTCIFEVGTKNAVLWCGSVDKLRRNDAKLVPNDAKVVQNCAIFCLFCPPEI